MDINEVRSKYLAFMEQNGHAIVPSASLVPQNDPTTLFTGSGMQPMLPYLLGSAHPRGTRIADSQKSFRAGDIEEVGDNRHTTFFEMLGNWSLGDYFKREQLTHMYRFLTEEIGIDPNKLYVTVFAGDPSIGIPQDDESIRIWQELFFQDGIEAKFVTLGSEADGYEKGMQGGKIFAYDVSKNWWSRAGVPNNMPDGEPGGPDSEMFFDFGTKHDETFGAQCHPNCDCGRFIEMGNNVFMEYLKQGGTFEKLSQRNVDFGGGLERIAAASNDDNDVFRLDVFSEMIAIVERFSHKSYADPAFQRSFRIIADHARAATFLLADGVRPSNTDQGYVLRRLLRRALQHCYMLGVEHDQGDESLLNRCAAVVIEKYKHAYPELDGEPAYQAITQAIWDEELQFGHALDKGMKEFEKIAEVARSISGDDAYKLFTTYGFPFEMTKEIAQERGLAVDSEKFKELMKGHQALSRAGSEQKFKGGLADHSVATTRLHTAHHLLLRALQEVLGAEVKQRGSNITAERLRIDFSYGAKMTAEQIKDVELIVNEKIKEALPVVRSTLPKAEAEKLGAEHEFGAKYPDIVSVYSIGPKEATLENPRFREGFSIEFCGGPHVENTAGLGAGFKIQKEEAVAAGIRRIKATLGN